MHFSTVEWEEFASFREYKTFYNRLKSFLKIFFTKNETKLAALISIMFHFTINVVLASLV